MKGTAFKKGNFDCQEYGPYVEDLHDHYCIYTCPPGWKDYGLMCEKPYKYQGQKTYTFKEKDFIKAVEQH